jgi:hypothetical protein
MNLIYMSMKAHREFVEHLGRGRSAVGEPALIPSQPETSRSFLDKPGFFQDV